MHIGDKVQEIRKAKRMTLTELSESSGVQIATLSRIEHKKMVGTLDSHVQIAKSLGVDVTELYKGLSQQDPLLDFGNDEKAEVFAHSKKTSIEMLTKNLMNKRMMPTLLRIEEGGRTNKEKGQSGTEKFLFVLDGRVEVNVNNQMFDLHKRNTLYFDAFLPHSLHNISKAPAKLLCVTSSA